MQIDGQKQKLFERGRLWWEGCPKSWLSMCWGSMGVRLQDFRPSVDMCLAVELKHVGGQKVCMYVSLHAGCWLLVACLVVGVLHAGCWLLAACLVHMLAAGCLLGSGGSAGCWLLAWCSCWLLAACLAAGLLVCAWQWGPYMLAAGCWLLAWCRLAWCCLLAAGCLTCCWRWLMLWLLAQRDV